MRCSKPKLGSFGSVNQSRLIFSLKDSPGYVAGQRLSDAELKTILPGAVALTFEGSDLDDERFLKIARLSFLRCLDLDCTAVSDNSLVAVARLSVLEELWLEDTRVTDAGLAFLHSCPTLKFVSVAYTAVTSEAVEALIRAVPGIDVAM